MRLNNLRIFGGDDEGGGGWFGKTDASVFAAGVVRSKGREGEPFNWASKLR
jgi:hypothetical protein